MQVVVIVLLRGSVYVPFILAHLFAFFNVTMTGSFFMMLKTVGRALISHLPRFFRLTGSTCRGISKDRYSFCASLCTTCKFNWHITDVCKNEIH